MSEHAHGTGPAFDEGFWDDRYRSARQVWSGQPNQQLVAEVAGRPAGRALDVGCGEGADAVWLARRGWHSRLSLAPSTSSLRSYLVQVRPATLHPTPNMTSRDARSSRRRQSHRLPVRCALRNSEHVLSLLDVLPQDYEQLPSVPIRSEYLTMAQSGRASGRGMLGVSTNETIVVVGERAAASLPVVVAQIPIENHAVSWGWLLGGGCRGERPRGSWRGR